VLMDISRIVMGSPVSSRSGAITMRNGGLETRSEILLSVGIEAHSPDAEVWVHSAVWCWSWTTSSKTGGLSIVSLRIGNRGPAARQPGDSGVNACD
jgi:hypothetical protein